MGFGSAGRVYRGMSWPAPHPRLRRQAATRRPHRTDLRDSMRSVKVADRTVGGSRLWRAKPHVGGPPRPASRLDGRGIQQPASRLSRALVDVSPGARPGVFGQVAIHLGVSPNCLPHPGGVVRISPSGRHTAVAGMATKVYGLPKHVTDPSASVTTIRLPVRATPQRGGGAGSGADHSERPSGETPATLSW